MNSESNDMLTALHKFWKWEADWMTCRACKRHLIASRDGEEFAHAADCKNAGLLHPWRSLRLILNDQPTQETSVAACPACKAATSITANQERCANCGWLGKPNAPKGASRE